MSNKTSDKNVANDIKILKKFCEYEEAVVLTDNALEEVQDAINNILAERKQDKKRIQELEEDLYSANCTISDYVDSIPKQKVKDKIGVLEVEEKYDYLDNKKAIQTLEELLEDK
mgnify:CR=1 FL=1